MKLSKLESKVGRYAPLHRENFHRPETSFKLSDCRLQALGPLQSVSLTVLRGYLVIGMPLRRFSRRVYRRLIVHYGTDGLRPSLAETRVRMRNSSAMLRVCVFIVKEIVEKGR